MKTGHLEIMSTLAGLCKPDPKSGAVLFQPVLDQLVKFYGRQVGHPDFHHAFRFVMSAGGAGSNYAYEGYDALHDGLREREAAEDAV